MGRVIGAVIAGYVVMFAVVFITFTGAYLAMGTEGAFQPMSYDVSMLWVVASTALGLVAAVLGGLTCVAIAPGTRAPMFLIGLVVVLGLVMALPVLMASGDEAPQVRPDDVSSMEAMAAAKAPTWSVLLNPILGAVGVFVGARLKGGGVAG